MTRKELEAQVNSILMPVASPDWLVERVCDFVELYARQQNGAKPLVSGSLPLFPDDERIAVESITQGSKEVGLGAISQVYFRKGAKWMRGQLGGNDR